MAVQLVSRRVRRKTRAIRAGPASHHACPVFDCLFSRPCSPAPATVRFSESDGADAPSNHVGRFSVCGFRRLVTLAPGSRLPSRSLAPTDRPTAIDAHTAPDQLTAHSAARAQQFRLTPLVTFALPTPDRIRYFERQRQPLALASPRRLGQGPLPLPLARQDGHGQARRR